MQPRDVVSNGVPEAAFDDAVEFLRKTSKDDLKLAMRFSRRDPAGWAGERATRFEDICRRPLPFHPYPVGLGLGAEGHRVPSLTGGSARPPSATRFDEHFTPEGEAWLNDFLHEAFGSRLGPGERAAYPSAGAIHPVELWVLDALSAFEGDHVRVRRRDPVDGTMESIARLRSDALRHALFPLGERQFEAYAYCLAYVIAVDRAVYKYGHRGLMFAAFEVGSMYQSAEVAARARGLSSRVWGAFAGYRLNALTASNPSLQHIAMVQFLGRTAGGEDA